ncbi:MAG: ECF transporter S component [Candidatus Ranarchaeia archaeon]
MSEKTTIEKSYSPFSSKNLAATAVLSALGAILEMFPVDIAFPFFTALKFTPSGIPVVIAAISLGPISGIIVCFIHVLAILVRGNLVGALFKFPAEFLTALPIALIFWLGRKKIQNNPKVLNSISFIGIIVGMIGRVTSMVFANLLLLPFFYSMPLSAVYTLLPLIALFNAIQALYSILPALVIIQVLPPDMKPEWLSSTENFPEGLE